MSFMWDIQWTLGISLIWVKQFHIFENPFIDISKQLCLREKQNGLVLEQTGKDNVDDIKTRLTLTLSWL